MKVRDLTPVDHTGDIVLSANEAVMRRYQNILRMQPRCHDTTRWQDEPLAHAIVSASNRHTYLTLLDPSFTPDDIISFHETAKYLREQGHDKISQRAFLATLIGTTREMAAVDRNNPDADQELIDMMDEGAMLNY